jgi:hypothetical protein
MVDERGPCPRPSKACGLTTCELPVLRIRLRRRWISENTKANSFAIFLDSTKRIFPDSGVPYPLVSTVGFAIFAI